MRGSIISDMQPKRGRPRKPRVTPDVEWFRERFRSAGLSQKDVAGLLARNAAVLTRSLKGERRFDLDDLAGLSKVLGVSTDELMRRLGHEIRPRGVPIVGTLTGDGRVSTVSSRKGETVPVADAPSDAVAIIAETENTPLAAYHGAVFIHSSGNGGLPVPTDAFGRLCIVEAEGQLVPLFGTLGKAPTRGAVTLTLFGGGETLTLTKIHRAVPLVQIIFP